MNASNLQTREATRMELMFSYLWLTSLWISLIKNYSVLWVVLLLEYLIDWPEIIIVNNIITVITRSVQLIMWIPRTSTPHNSIHCQLPILPHVVEDSGTAVERRPLRNRRSRVRTPWWAGSAFVIFPHKRGEYWLSIQEADIERDYYKLKACFEIDVKLIRLNLPFPSYSKPAAYNYVNIHAKTKKAFWKYNYWKKVFFGVTMFFKSRQLQMHQNASTSGKRLSPLVEDDLSKTTSNQNCCWAFFYWYNFITDLLLIIVSSTIELLLSFFYSYNFITDLPLIIVQYNCM